jgi:hypothetical protein
MSACVDSGSSAFGIFKYRIFACPFSGMALIQAQSVKFSYKKKQIMMFNMGNKYTVQYLIVPKRRLKYCSILSH